MKDYKLDHIQKMIFLKPLPRSYSKSMNYLNIFWSMQMGRFWVLFWTQEKVNLQCYEICIVMKINFFVVFCLKLN